MLTSVHRQRRLQQEADLVPVCARAPRRSGEQHTGVGAFEDGVEPPSHAVYEARLVDLEVEGDFNAVQALHGHGGEVEPCGLRLAHETVGVHVVYDWLPEVLLAAASQGSSEVNAVEGSVLPEAVLVLLLPVQHGVGEGRDTQVPNVREHLPSWLEKAVTGAEVGLNHALVEEEGAYGLRDEDIDLALDFVLDGLQRPVDDLEGRAREVVRVSKLADHLAHGGGLHGIDKGGARLRREEGEDAAASADVHDRHTPKVVGVLKDCSAVGARTHAVLQHVLLVAQLGIILEVALHTALFVLLETLVVVLALHELVDKELSASVAVTLQAHMPQLS
mmetsp:Transcript_48477/g.112348  ORF Transcript_48477/g.112348 Transcript_48477/m.112348 type:complete len:333 (+) Transcript_48477:420-1418(+)